MTEDFMEIEFTDDELKRIIFPEILLSVDLAINPGSTKN